MLGCLREVEKRVFPESLFNFCGFDLVKLNTNGVEEEYLTNADVYIMQIGNQVLMSSFEKKYLPPAKQQDELLDGDEEEDGDNQAFGKHGGEETAAMVKKTNVFPQDLHETLNNECRLLKLSRKIGGRGIAVQRQNKERKTRPVFIYLHHGKLNRSEVLGLKEKYGAMEALFVLSPPSSEEEASFTRAEAIDADWNAYEEFGVRVKEISNVADLFMESHRFVVASLKLKTGFDYCLC